MVLCWLIHVNAWQHFIIFCKVIKSTLDDMSAQHRIQSDNYSDLVIS